MTLFSDLKLDPRVLQAVAEAGYETPTPIQAGAIPPALEGRDVLGIAQTGTGKTASFTLPMITLLGRGRARARMPRSLVLCPTRELAAQVAENFDVYARHTRLTKALLIGGVSFGEQDKLIDRGVDVLIATPGRLLDHFERGKLLLTGVQIMVVDEADRMLDMGFIPDIERIFQLTPFTRQTLFFSATMAPEIERITNTFLHAPERIEVARQATTSETITQKLVELTPTRKDQTAKQKRELLRALIDAEGPATETGGLKNAIIFCNRKTEVDIVAKSLKAHGYDAAPIHGDLDQRVRMATLDGFREGTLRFLVASDVAARGLDIPAVSHVFNFDLPSHAEDYVHRIGRTGRAGRLGTAISIATPSDEKYLSAIENLVKQTLPRAAAPAGFDLTEAARSAPREPAERSDRSRSRTRSRRRSDAEAGDAVAPAAALAPAEEQASSVLAPAVQRSEERAPRNGGPTRRAADAESHSGERQGDRASAPGAREADRRDSDRRGGRDERRDSGRDERRGDRRDEARRDDGRHDARRDEPRREDNRRDDGRREDSRRDDTRRDEGRDRSRDRGRDRDRGPAVVGMGEHVPDFMLTSFRPALNSLTEGERTETPAIQPTPAPSAPVAPASAAPAEAMAPASSAPSAASAPAEAAPVEAAAEPVAAPTRARRSRASSRRPRAAEGGDASATLAAAAGEAAGQAALSAQQVGAETVTGPQPADAGAHAVADPSDPTAATDAASATAEAASPEPPPAKPKRTRAPRKKPVPKGAASGEASGEAAADTAAPVGSASGGPAAEDRGTEPAPLPRDNGATPLVAPSADGAPQDAAERERTQDGGTRHPAPGHDDAPLG